jgi:hypothetical protein
MYSGSTFRTKSGLVMGVHQRIDRIAYRHVKKQLSKKVTFPSVADILHFEGMNGPDGIKRKSPAKDEPWHYIDPGNLDDRQLLIMINDHIFNMAQALKDKNYERASFEAAWMAHAIVDGLTPAHHYPLNEKIEELWGKPKEERLTIRDKSIIHGINRRDTFSKNWQYWGAKGVFTNHFMFEWGVATTMAAQRFDKTSPSLEDFQNIASEDFDIYYMKTLNRIASLEMYKEFCRSGWNRRLAGETRSVLVPEIIRAVSLGWYKAVRLSETLK